VPSAEGVPGSHRLAARATILRMGQLLLYIAAALVIAAIVFGVTVMLGGGDPGLTPTEPDGRAVPLPSDRPLAEEDLIHTTFDTALRGYRMSQVDQALQRAAYDIGYKGELIGVLEAEVLALREGRIADADMLRRAREAALAPPVVADDTAAITEAPAAGPPAPPGPQDQATAGRRIEDDAPAGRRAGDDAPGRKAEDDARTGRKPEADKGRKPAADTGRRPAGDAPTGRNASGDAPTGRKPATEAAADDDDRDGEPAERR
jgi:DivIVA domain-containing protein